MKKYKIIIINTIILFFCLSCKINTEEHIIKPTIVGTWKIESMFLGDSENSSLDNVSILSQNLPCMKNYTITFASDGTFMIASPINCLDIAQSEIFLLPSRGQYIMQSETQLAIYDVNSNVKQGSIVMTADKIKWQIRNSKDNTILYEYVFSK